MRWENPRTLVRGMVILKELKQKFKNMGINKDMSDIIREAVEEMQRRIKEEGR